MRNSIKILNLLTLVLMITFFTGCGAYKAELVKEIETNETAFLVPMEGASKTDQGRFMSIDFLEEAKVATKRVTLPQRRLKTGRAWFSYKWIPTVRVVKVDRTPVTREWTQDEVSGTSNKNEAIHVESKESIGFAIGVNVTTFVKEDDAATFLYWYAGKPLSEVVDENVRGFVTSILSKEFGSRDLVDGRGEKATIFDTVFITTKEHFALTGITIDNLGYAEGLIYEDVEIQTGINERFLAELNVQTSAQKKLGQDELNAMTVAMATAEREAAEQFARAEKAAKTIRQLEIDMKLAEAQLVAANKWNGNLPANIIPEGGGFIFDISPPNN